LGVSVELHYLDAPKSTRWQRVQKRNKEKNPTVYAIEVTGDMFNFMEPRFEVPDNDEMKHVKKIQTS